MHDAPKVAWPRRALGLPVTGGARGAPSRYMIGRTITHYKILERLGAGGMGVVYKAEDLKLRRLVALKFLPLREHSSKQEKERFQREARAAAALDHPNICTVYEIDEAEGRSFIAMAYIEGPTVQEKIEQAPLNLDDALEFTIQAATGLSAAHEKGVVHRDIKSANLMLTKPGTGDEPRLKIMDFGLAQLAAAGKLTLDGTALGTAAYMSPEQTRGEKVDKRTDIWSLGVVLHEMLTGEMPFPGEYPQAIFYSILHEEPVPVTSLRSGVDLEFERIIRKTLAKDTNERYQSAVDLLVDLRTLKKNRDLGRSKSRTAAYVPRTRAQSAVAVPFSKTPEGHKPLRRYLIPAALAAVLVLAAAIVPRFFRPMGPRHLHAVRLTPITSDPGTESFASFSPDGSQIVYVWDGGEAGQADIYVRLVEGGGTPLRLTDHPAPESSPAWSPDGRYVAFVRHERGMSGVYLIPPIGGAERKLTEFRAHPRTRSVRLLAWSPDGQTLAIARSPARDEPGGIVLLDLRTSKTTTLAAPGPAAKEPAARESAAREPASRGRSATLSHSPAFSPDGARLALIRTEGLLSSDIYVAAADGSGGEPRRVTSEERPIDGLAWMADGESLVFSSQQGGVSRLWRVRASGGSIHPFAEAGENARLPAISAKGDRLAFTRTMRDLNIWRAELTGDTLRVGEARAIIASTRSDASPRFSPDASRIAFVSDRSGAANVWVADGDGSHPRKLTSYDGPVPSNPLWSPAGDHIAIQVSAGSETNIDLISPSGGAPRRLTSPDFTGMAAGWSRDGEWIYLSRRAEGLWKLSVHRDTEAQAVPLPNLSRFVNESSDGAFLFYSAGRRDVRLWRLPLAGGEPEPLPDELAPWGAHRWTVTRRGIFFLDRDSNLKLYDVAAETITSLGRFEAMAAGSPGDRFSIADDGRAVLFTRADRDEADLTLIEGFQ